MAMIEWEKDETVAVIKLNNGEYRHNLEFAQTFNRVLDEVIEDKMPLNLDENNYTSDEWAVISTLLKVEKGVHIDEIRWKSKIEAGQLSNILLNLEFKGIVKVSPGKKYTLN